jgi:hypothetical protein
VNKRKAMERGKNSEIAYLKSMVFCLDKVMKDGYVENFTATTGGLESGHTHKLYTPDQVKVINFFLFEGFTDPNDNAIMYVLETNDGIKGTLIDDSYGSYADSMIKSFIKAAQSSDNNSIIH